MTATSCRLSAFLSGGRASIRRGITNEARGAALQIAGHFACDRKRSLVF